MSASDHRPADDKPVFADIRDGNSLARAIMTHLAALRREGRPPAEVCVASCYFNLQGLDLIASEVRHVPHIRLLLGAEPTPEALVPQRTLPEDQLDALLDLEDRVRAPGA